MVATLKNILCLCLHACRYMHVQLQGTMHSHMIMCGSNMFSHCKGGTSAKAVVVATPQRKGEAKLYAINVKPGGRVHCFSDVEAQRPPSKRRALCGWQTGRCVAQVAFCTRVEAGTLCRKCCYPTALPTGKSEEGDVIEQFA